MTQATAIQTPALPTAATKVAGAPAVTADGFAAALAQLLGLAAPTQTQPNAQAPTNVVKLAQHAARTTSALKDTPDAAGATALAAVAVPNQALQGDTPQTLQAAEPNAQPAYAAAVLKALGATPKGATSAAPVQPNAAADAATAEQPTPVAAAGQPHVAQQTAQFNAAAVANLSALPQTIAANTAKAVQKPASSKQAPNAASTDTPAAASTTGQTTNQKTPAVQPVATPTQHPTSDQNLAGTTSQLAGEKADSTAAQSSPPASTFVINMHDTGNTAQTPSGPAAPPQAAIPLDALAVNIARKFESGESRFEIRLDPAGLGKLDISLTVGDDGRVQAVLRAERPETLDMLQRDARVLEQQLRQSGLGVDSNSLNFSLGGGNGQRQAMANGTPAFAPTLIKTPDLEIAQTTSALVSVRDGLDIRI